MPEFAYLARTLQGEDIRGTIAAVNEHSAAAALLEENVFPYQIKPQGAAESSRLTITRSVRSAQVAAFYSQLSDLLRAGVPLLESLSIVADQATPPAFRSVIAEVRREVAEGVPLSQALARHPRIFPSLAIHIIAAGEAGAFLEDVLARLADFVERQQELRSRLTGALAYPVFLLVVGLLVVTGMLVWFVPQFTPLFERLSDRNQLPLATSLLMTLSGFAGQYGFWIACAAVASTTLLVRYLQTDAGSRILHRWLLNLYGAGPIIRSLAIARFTRILATLLRNGVPLLQAMWIASGVTGNRVLGEAIEHAADGLAEGTSLADPLAASGHFPAEVIAMISIGEKSNTLDDVLTSVADRFEQRTWRQLDLLMRLLEPSLLLVMAGIVLFIVMGLLLPIFNSSGAL